MHKKDVTLAGLGCLLLTLGQPALGLSLEEQRVRYTEAMTAYNSQDLTTFAELSAKLKQYPLYPYLAYHQLQAKLPEATLKEVLAFEKHYSALPFTNRLRASYLQTLAQRQDWQGLLEYQTVEPLTEVQRCNYYYAHAQVGNKQTAIKGAKKLYLSGNYVDKACDPLFAYLQAQQQVNNQLMLDRLLLAYGKNNAGLMRYLQTQVTGDAKIKAEQVLDLYKNPQKVAAFSKKSKVTPFNQALTKLAFERLMAKNPEQAVKDFTLTVDGQKYSAQQRQRFADRLASLLMARQEPELATWRDKWLDSTKNQSLLERRFRMALIANDWRNMAHWVQRMAPQTQAEMKWQYWHARILAQQGKKTEAKKRFNALLGKRDFYSVAAAMALNQPITLPWQTTALDSSHLEPFQIALARVDEWLTLEDPARARIEWQQILNRATQAQKAMLAAYAQDKKWHDLAVQATISGQLWEHLEYRFPVAHRWWFEFFSQKRQLSMTTLLALSRQESAFYTHAVSPVGARGLMQLMPATAKETSNKLGYKYLGNQALTDPGTNIRLGSGYLRILLDQFEQNRILAFAAYNAGPHRAQRWLASSNGELDVFGFIESITFNETRHYVQNVLMYDLYYRKLLGMPLTFLSPQELAKKY